MKQNLKDFILELLKNHNVSGIRVSNQNVRCQCPYHRPNETKISSITFSISFEEEAGLWRCFSCGQQGNIYQLIMHFYNCSYRKAEKIFLSKVSVSPITLEYIQKTYNSMFKNNDHNIEAQPLVDLPPKFSPRRMLDYLKWRNAMVAHNMLDINFIVSLYNLYYCDQGRYAERIIMPIRDFHGRNVYFTNRSVHHNSDKKNLFQIGGNSGNFLYGLYEALGKDNCMLVEGPFEVFQLKCYAKKHKLFNWGFVGLMGHEMNEIRATLISSAFKRTYVCLDNEEETWKKNPKTGLNKEDQVCNILADFMPCHKITEKLYPGKEPGNSSERQLEKLFEVKHDRRLVLVDKVSDGRW